MFRKFYCGRYLSICRKGYIVIEIIDIYLFVEKGTFCSNSGVGEIMAAITLSTDLKSISMWNS